MIVGVVGVGDGFSAWIIDLQEVSRRVVAIFYNVSVFVRVAGELSQPIVGFEDV